VPRRSDEDDRRLFEEEMQDVRPLERRTGRAVPIVSPREAPARVAAIRLEVVERWGEKYALLAPGADRRLLKELPQRKVDAELDLHGLRREEARAALKKFMAGARRAGCRTVLVVHGRGHRSGAAGPVLCDVVIEALTAPPLAAGILAVTNAPSARGGPGAALVLLRAGSTR
jgi:DNA-nicking Smr family endonuclease